MALNNRSHAYIRLFNRIVMIAVDIPSFMQILRSTLKQFPDKEMIFRLHSYPFPPHILNGSMEYHVELRDSPIHGKGLFTTHPVKKGEYLGVYMVGSIISATTTQQEEFTEGIRIHDMLLTPSTSTDPCISSAAHFVNDGGYFEGNPLFYPELYEDFAKVLCNCEFVIVGGFLVMAVATKDIPEPGTELLTRYGFDYWHFRLLHDPLLPTRARNYLAITGL